MTGITEDEAKAQYSFPAFRLKIHDDGISFERNPNHKKKEPLDMATTKKAANKAVKKKASTKKKASKKKFVPAEGRISFAKACVNLLKTKKYTHEMIIDEIAVEYQDFKHVHVNAVEYHRKRFNAAHPDEAVDKMVEAPKRGGGIKLVPHIDKIPTEDKPTKEKKKKKTVETVEVKIKKGKRKLKSLKTEEPKKGKKKKGKKKKPF